MNNYHTLPCGTPIPPEGIEAWVREQNHDKWEPNPVRIFAHVNGKYLVYDEKYVVFYKHYSLTDPTKQKKRLVTPMELLGKFVHFSTGTTSLAVSADKTRIHTVTNTFKVERILEVAVGYSDTPTSELKSFWVEEV
jgi:hypothetical protein